MGGGGDSRSRVTRGGGSKDHLALAACCCSFHLARAASLVWRAEGETAVSKRVRMDVSVRRPSASLALCSQPSLPLASQDQEHGSEGDEQGIYLVRKHRAVLCFVPLRVGDWAFPCPTTPAVLCGVCRSIDLFLSVGARVSLSCHHIPVRALDTYLHACEYAVRPPPAHPLCPQTKHKGHPPQRKASLLAPPRTHTHVPTSVPNPNHEHATKKHSKQGDYVRAALTTPWDVLGYCRSAVLNRVRALVVSLEGASGGKKGMGKAEPSLLPNLHQLVGQLAGASAYFWDAQSAEGLQQ